MTEPTPTTEPPHEHLWTVNDSWDGGTAPYSIRQCMSCNAIEDRCRECGEMPINRIHHDGWRSGFHAVRLTEGAER